MSIDTFCQIFKILVETECLSLIDSIRCLQTCKYIYTRYRKWFGDRRPLYKIISTTKYNLRKQQEKTDYWKKIKQYKRQTETEKALKFYQSIKQLLLKEILKKLNQEFQTKPHLIKDLYNLTVKSGDIIRLRFVSVDVIPGTNPLVPYKKFVKILKRKKIEYLFKRDLNEYIAIHYPKLSLLNGHHNEVQPGSHDLGIKIYQDFSKRPKNTQRRGGKNKKYKNKKNWCIDCQEYH